MSEHKTRVRVHIFPIVNGEWEWRLEQEVEYSDGPVWPTLYTGRTFDYADAKRVAIQRLKHMQEPEVILYDEDIQ